MKKSMPEAPEVTVQLVARGDVSAGDREYARTKVAKVFGWIGEPVPFARVKLTRSANPAASRPALAQANLDVDGHAVRAQVAAETMREAIDLLMARLRALLTRVNEHWQPRRGARPKPGPQEWRHASEPAHRPEHYHRPAAEREVIRHKSFAVPWESVDEAVFDMESMDYDFHLFTDVATDQDSVVYRDEPTGYRLAQLAPRAEPGPVAVRLTVSTVAAPVLNLAQARERLDNTDMPFVFFAAGTTGRGNVLYHRYDGHYGLITPARAEPGASSPPGP
jgi:ribosome-associated translation inhibitor RaiA